MENYNNNSNQNTSGHNTSGKDKSREDTLEDLLRQIDFISKFLDTQFEVPGLGWRFGIDPIIGLIPGLGDLLSSGIGAYPILMAVRHNFPRAIIAQMIFNWLLDLVVGQFPVVGDLFDWFYKSNRKNFDLFVKGAKSEKAQNKSSKIFIFGVSAAVILALVSPFIILGALLF